MKDKESYPPGDATILLVDDNLSNVDLLSKMLTAHGYKVRPCTSARFALQSALSNPPDLALLDIKMPDMDGINLCKELKRDPRTSDVPVIFISALHEIEDKVRAFEAGGVDYLTKPFHDAEVLVRVRNQLNLFRMQTRLEQLVQERTAELTSANKALKKEIAERVQAEEALRESEERLRLLVESAEDMIVMQDLDGVYLYYSATPRYGLEPEQILSKTPFDFHDSTTAAQMLERVKQVAASGQGLSVESSVAWQEETLWFSDQLSPIKDDAGRVVAVMTISRNITERVQAEEQVKTSLEEKKVLLQELYHRTKNNMSVICAMLELQSVYTKDEQVLSIFRETGNRIQSMALVHQMLYQSQDLSKIDLGKYIDDLAALLTASHGVPPDKVALVVDAESIPMLIDSAIPCGLVLNELISNTFKHAFPGERSGEVQIRLCQQADGTIVLQVSDDGIGVSEDFDLRKGDSLGLQMVLGIVEGQLQGDVEVETDCGLMWQIRFRDDQYGPRV